MTVTAPDMMIAPALDTQPNRLLAALPAADFERLLPHLERVPLALGKVLYEPGERLAHAYFPTTRSEEHTSELQSLMRISYAVFCLKKKKITKKTHITHTSA